MTTRAAHVTTPQPPDRVAKVGRVMVCGITLGLIGLLGRVVQLQLHPPKPLTPLVDSQDAHYQIQNRRGSLFDRQGRLISGSDVYYRLFIDPKAVTDPGSFSERVGYLLGYDPAMLEQLIDKGRSQGTRFVLIDPHLSDQRLALLSRVKLPGIGTEMRMERQYMWGVNAGQLVGFVGFDGHGLEGLEQQFDRQLLGKAGEMVYLRDAALRPLEMDQREYQPAADGRSIRLSLDGTIQAVVENELRRACQDFGAQSGQMVVMNPATGEVLAMANYPAFDPAEAGRTPPDLRRNRCITDVFEPGSIFKPVVWSSATQLRYANPAETIDCTTGGLWVTPSGRRLHDAHPNGSQTWDGVLVKSSNIGMGKIGERIGSAALNTIVRGFGFGETTGSTLRGESPGLVNQMRRWTAYSVTSIPMGQEIGVTPLQMTRAYCAFANGGLLLKPSFVPDAPPQVIGRVLMPDVADHTRLVLRRVVTEGTGKKAESKLYTIWGKTGTAQIPDHEHGGYLPDGYVASFVGGAPVNQPRIVVGCFIHHPDKSKGHFGGIVAAPAVKSVIEQTLAYLGVPPDQTTPNLNAGPIDARE